MGLHDRTFRDSLASMLQQEQAPTAHEVLDLLVDRFVPDILIEDLPFHDPKLYAKKRLILLMAQKVYEDSPPLAGMFKALDDLDRHGESRPYDAERLEQLTETFLELANLTTACYF